MGSEMDVLLGQFPTAGKGLKSMLLAETPAHEVTIAPFQMDRFAVTNAEFLRFTRSRLEWRRSRVGGDYLRHWQGDQFPGGFARLPVVFVSWQAAAAYADWAGKRLPTEAEWEFAARGGLTSPKYPWGNEEPTPERANYRLSALHGPVPVGSYPPNPYGLFDLAGNVWQFCLDEWLPYSAGPRRQSKEDLRQMRLASAERRVIRGGSFDGDAFNMRVTARDSHKADHPVGYVGFRCAKSG
jgi:formylglycine-generating enzyme required for sulfatase activity